VLAPRLGNGRTAPKTPENESVNFNTNVALVLDPGRTVDEFDCYIDMNAMKSAGQDDHVVYLLELGLLATEPDIHLESLLPARN